MSQIEVLIAIQELGGRATKKAIVKRMTEKFPNDYMINNISPRLTQLRKNGTLTRDEKTKEWIIIDDTVLRTRNIIQNNFTNTLSISERD